MESMVSDASKIDNTLRHAVWRRRRLLAQIRANRAQYADTHAEEIVKNELEAVLAEMNQRRDEAGKRRYVPRPKRSK